MNKTISIVIGIILVLLVGGVVFYQSQQSTPVAIPNPTTSTTTTSTGGSGTTYTMAQVATHRDAISCWTIIDGNVYDLTKWIPQHPGGEQAILSICGIDGSAAFHGQHNDAKRQADILATFKIGTLAQ